MKNNVKHWQREALLLKVCDDHDAIEGTYSRQFQSLKTHFFHPLVQWSKKHYKGSSEGKPWK